MVDEDIVRCKKLLEDNGYVVARMAEPDWQEKAFRFGDEFVAFRLEDKLGPGVAAKQPAWIRPGEFCNLIGIERHTLPRNLQNKKCPKIELDRGPKGKRLVRLRATQEFITFLRRNKPRAKVSS
jgi:hypothetical protein